MTAHSQRLTAIAIAYADLEAAQRRYDRAVARGDTQTQRRALERLQQANLRALALEVRP
jgi:hypothetical protein